MAADEAGVPQEGTPAEATMEGTPEVVDLGKAPAAEEQASQEPASPNGATGQEKAEVGEVEVAESGYDIEWKITDREDEEPLHLHASALGGTLLWDMAEIQHGMSVENAGPLYGFLLELLGPEQMRACRAHIAKANLGPNEGASVMTDLLDTIGKAARISVGESQASPDS